VSVIESFSRILCGQHPSALASMPSLASTYRNQGRWEAGKPLQIELLNLRKSIFGEEHPSTPAAMANLSLSSLTV
jgi:hypothetical protein